MITKQKEIMVGIFVIISIIVLVLGVISFGKLKIANNYYLLNGRFNDVNNLAVGAPVLVGGVKIGRVGKIYLVNDKVIVEMLIRKDVKISKKAKVSVILKGIIGDMIVSIYNPLTEKTFFEEGETIEGDDPITMSTFFKKANAMMNEIDEATKKIEKLQLGDEVKKTLESSQKLMKDTDRFVNNANDVLLKNINQAILRADKVLLKIDETIPNKERLERILDKVEKDIDDRNKDLAESFVMVKQLLKNVDLLIKSTDGLIVDNKEKLSNTVSNFELITNKTLALIESINKKVDGVDTKSLNDSFKNISEISTDIKIMIKDLQGTLKGSESESIKNTIKNSEKITKELDNLLDNKISVLPELELDSNNDIKANLNVEFLNRPSNVFLRAGKNSVDEKSGKYSVVIGQKFNKLKVGVGLIKEKAGARGEYRFNNYFGVSAEYYNLKDNNLDLSADFWLHNAKVYFKYNVNDIYYMGVGYKF